MNKAIEFSTKHPISILMYFCLIIILGAISAFCINASLLPQAKERWILVSANYNGVRASEIRKLVTIPLEENLQSLKDVKSVESVSRDESCAIKIELKWSANADAALLETNAILDSAMEWLPEDCQRPKAKKIGGSSGQVKLCAIPLNGDLAAASDFCQNELKAKILALEECGGVEIFGGQKTEIQIIVDSKKAAFYGLDIDAICQCLNLSNYDYPAGTIQDGQNDILLKTEGTFKSFGEILDTTLKTNRGPLKLRDIARVQKGQAKSDSFCFYNSERCALVAAFCKNRGNPMAFSRKIKALVEGYNSSQKNLQVKICDDSAKEINQALKNLFASAAFGIAISFAMLYLFFRSAALALAIAAAIPLSALFSFFALLALGKSANIISLSGITLCLGMIIDNSIVAMESALEGAKESCGKKNFASALQTAIQKTALSNSASTITTIIVFIPVFFIGGIIGELWTDLGISVLAGMAFSLAFSWTVLPALCVLFLQKEFLKAKKMDLRALESKCQKIFERAQKIKGLCQIITAGSIVLAFLLLVPLKKELQPKSRQNAFTAQIVLEPGTSADVLARTAKTASALLMELPGAQAVLASGGLEKDKPQILADPQAQAEKLFFTVKSADALKTKSECKKLFSALGLQCAFLEEQDLISERLGINSSLLLFGQNPSALYEEAQEIFGSDFVPNCAKTQKVFKANKALMEKASITPLALSAALKSSFDGSGAFPYYENGKEITVKVQYEKDEFSSNKNLSALRVQSPKGILALSALGGWQDQKAECVFYRNNGMDAKIIPQEAALKTSKAARQKIVSLQKQSAKELFKSGALLLFIVLVLLYCLLGAQTESFVEPLVFLLAVPPAFLGAAVFTAVFSRSLNINTIMALVALFGTSVNSSIILREGGRKKFGSVLITNATSAGSLLPFAIDPFNANPQSGLALAILGGLLFSAAGSLLLICGRKKR